ncbi:MAG: hypothetical protein QOJ53_622, partial [Sphingomonadales bacterium]|nr:hypothetical protein [Sphingomonadales bacterium]
MAAPQRLENRNLMATRWRRRR